MKRTVCITIFSLFVFSFIQAKQLPDFVQQRLDSVKKETKHSLINYRIWKGTTDGYMTLPIGLGFYLSGDDIFPYDETHLIDSLRLNLSVGMIYDDEMRNRIVQLLRNALQEWELDTLVNRAFKLDMRDIQRLELEAMGVAGIDTMSLFKNSLDSLYAELESRDEVERWKKRDRVYDTEILKQMQLDTTALFRQAFDNILEREREKVRKEYLSVPLHSPLRLVRLCGYIGDQRFVQPLLDIMEKNPGYDYSSILEALTRMRVEPYYSDYVKKRTLTKEQIMDEKVWLDFKVEDFAHVLGTQEAFLELSKYLLSNKPYEIVSGRIDYEIPISSTAFRLIQDNVLNKDFQKLIEGRDDYDKPELPKLVYDWMQKNYGKYEIRRRW